MPYRRPGVEVVQEFQALAPALVLPALPAVVVGPAYQIADNETTATAYAGVAADYSYPSLVVGGVVDTNALDSDELESIQKPIDVTIKTAYIKLNEETDTGTSAVGDQTFIATGAFTKLPSVFGAVKYYVEITEGGADDGKHLIISKTDDDTVEIADELTLASATVDFRLLQLSDSIEYANSTFTDMGITTSATLVSLPTDLPSDPDDATSDPISEAADVEISYRALRPDLADALSVYTDQDSLEAIFGIGTVVPANPYAYGVNVALNNTTTEINATGLRATFFTDESAAYQTALEFLESEDVYAVVVLTQSTAVHQTLNSHVTNQSVSTVGRERIGFINRKIQSTEVVIPTSGVGTVTTAGTDNGTSPAADNTTFKDPTNGAFITDGVGVADFVEVTAYSAVEGADPVRSPAAVTSTGSDSLATGTNVVVQTATGTWTAFTAADVGRTIRIASSGFGNDGDYTIASFTNATTVVVTEAIPANETGGTYTFQLLELMPSTAQNTFITTTRHSINSVDSNTQLTLATDPTNGFFGTIEDVEYQITDDLTKDEEATFLAGYATSFANRRLVSVWPDTAVAAVAGTDTTLPGYFFGCSLVGLTAGLPSQQGFTNLSLTGFTGRANSNDRYSDTQLDTIAGGGNMILAQDVPQAPLFVRHQLTTNTSTIQFQELSITKNVDLVARFFRGLYSPYIGKYNITDTLFDILKSITVAGIDFLKNSKAPRVGGVLRDGSIDALGEDAAQPDSVNIRLDINVPFPLNNVKVTLLV